MTQEQIHDETISRLDYADLFEMNIRGLVAGMFLHRGFTPSEDEWDCLIGRRELSLRAIGQIAARLGFDVSFSVSSRKEARP